jgi:hypothetical protein
LVLAQLLRLFAEDVGAAGAEIDRTATIHRNPRQQSFSPSSGFRIMPLF